MNRLLVPDADHVVRYCKPRYVDQCSGIPSVDAFRLRLGEGDLSVNWLEYTGFRIGSGSYVGRSSAVAQIRKSIQLGLNRSGAFALFNVLALKEVLAFFGGADPRVEHDPKGPVAARGKHPAKCADPSHALAVGFPDDDAGVGVELRTLLRDDLRNSVFPGCI